MWRDGCSARLIAEELGATRNAVIGKVHRLKLSAGRITLVVKVPARVQKRAPHHRPKKKPPLEEDDHARLSVQDAGVGLQPQDVESLFDPFYTTKSGGMGIGLSVSRSVIESHHGRLWAAPNVGPGATFAFSIPCKSERMTGAHSLGAIRTPTMMGEEPVMRNL
jgi:signal transduction histidine kinase